MKSMLQLTSVVKEFGTNKAVQKTSLEVKPGEIFSLIGPNGSGKTTIIKMIAGLYQPTKGTIKVGDFDVVEQPALAKSLLGYIPDDPAVWSMMTGLEFLHFTGQLFGIEEHERDKKIQSLLSVFQLQDKADSYFEDYSRGEKQKFAILAAMLHEPKLLLIDEPIVGLDPTSAETAQKLFREFADNGGAILIVTHTLPVAEKISDRIGVLSKGKLLAVGTFAELKKQAKLKTTAHLDDVYKAFAG